MSQIQPSAKALDLARQVLQIEADAVLALAERIDGEFLQALVLILNCRGRVIVSGMGKSGHVARKIASTLASTGTPAYFVHPRRSEPWRPRDDHPRRRADCAFQFGRRQ
jgi:arabinose-5-phosphate isomerase